MQKMKDPQIKRLVERVGYDEGLPVVINPGILDPKKFIDTVLKKTRNAILIDNTVHLCKGSGHTDKEQIIVLLL